MFENLPVQLEYFVRRETSADWQLPMRTIDNQELVLVVQGSGAATMDGKDYALSAGDLLYFHPGLWHSMIGNQAPYMVFYGVHFTLPPHVERLPLAPIQHLTSMRRIEAICSTLQDVHTQKNPLYRWQQNIALEQLLCEVFCVQHTLSTPVQQQRIEQVLCYIHANFQRQLFIDELAAQAHVKKSLLLQSFRQITGTTPIQYITHMRMEHARTLLIEGTATVAQIALQCGYSDPLYFSRCFKKVFGHAPMHFRRQHWL